MWSRNTWCLGIAFVLVCSFVSAGSIRINEVYVDSTSQYEWVELYNYGDNNVNLTNWQFGDEYDNDTIKGEIILESNKYGLLTSKLNYVYFLWDVGSCNKLYTEDALGNGLRDTGETIYLYDNLNNTIDFLSYPDLNNNKVYALNESNDWNIVVDGTPGLNNWGLNETVEEPVENYCDWKINLILNKTSFTKEEFEFRVNVEKINGDKTNVTLIRKILDVNETIISNYNLLTKLLTYRSNFNGPWSPNYQPGYYLIEVKIETDCDDTNLENNLNYKLISIIPKPLSTNYTNIEINELLPDPIGYDSAAMPNGEFVELYNKGNEDLDLLGLGLKDDYGQNIDIYISDSNTLNGTIIKANDYLAVYMNGRSGFLNNNGFEEISLFDGEVLIDDVSYSGSEENISWSKVDNKWIEMIPTPGRENVIEDEDEEEETVEEVVEVEVMPTISAEPKSIESNLKKLTGKIVYEDKGEKQKRGALYFFCALMILIIVYYAYGRE